MAEPLLAVRGLTKRFGGVEALSEVDVDFRAGEIVGVIGPNGSGKTTLFNCVCGFVRPNRGSVRWRREELVGLAPHAVARRGIGRTFQHAMTFPGLTVEDNAAIAVAAAARRRDGAALEVAALLDSVGLSLRRHAVAHELPFGEARRLGIAIALATRPDLLLLDEPAAGLNDAETLELRDLINRVRRDGATVAVIDHDMTLMLELCDRLVVLDFGRKIAEGDPSAVRQNRDVIEIYLGRE